MAYFCINERFSRKRDFSYIFDPQLHTKFRRNPRSGFWDMLLLTNGQTWFYIIQAKVKWSPEQKRILKYYFGGDKTIIKKARKQWSQVSQLFFNLVSWERAKNGKNWRFTGEKMVLCDRYIFLAHFGKIKKKSLERFFRKVSKTPKWRNFFVIF